MVNKKTVLSGAGSTVSSTMNTQQTSSGWCIQAASFSNLKSARTLANQLEQAGFKVSLAPHRVGGTTYYRVRVGPYPSKARAQSAAPGVARISRARVLIRKTGSGEE
jgi:cell division septation protein DedD